MVIVILVTHGQDVAAWATSILHFADGRLQETATPGFPVNRNARLAP